MSNAPVEVAADTTPRDVTGFDVGQTAFASSDAGWALVGSSGGDSRLLYTEDAGATWTAQLAWRGPVLGRITAFDARRAAFALGLAPGHRAVNGQPVPGNDHTVLLAGTQNAGRTWRLAPAPGSGQINTAPHFLAPEQAWLVRTVSRLPDRKVLSRSSDGGATWDDVDGPEGVPFAQVVFATATDGLVVTIPGGRRRDPVHETTDGGATWTPVPLAKPRGVPAAGLGMVDPVARPGGPVLLLLRAAPRREPLEADWAGIYAYRNDGPGWNWSGPYRLPMTPTWNWPDVAVPGPGGRFWAGSVKDLWTATDLAGPWEHRPVPLPNDEFIADIAPVDAGVLWLTTTRYPSPGATPPSGALYRSTDGGEHWTAVLHGEPEE